MKHIFLGLVGATVLVISGCGGDDSGGRFDMADRLIELHEQAQDDDKEVVLSGQVPASVGSSIPARYINMRREGGVLVLTPSKALLKERANTSKDAVTYLAADNIVLLHKDDLSGSTAYTVQFGQD